MKTKSINVLVAIFIALIFFTLSTGATNYKTNKIFEEKFTEETSSCETNYYAVIIGLEEFSGFDTPVQEYLDESATAFYNRLLESSNWQEENILLLLNENATKDNIHDAVTIWLAERENESDVVVFYVATHGWKTKLTDRKYGNAYFFTHNSSSFLYDKETKITDKELDSWLDTLDSKHIAVILENCYSGRWYNIVKYGRTLLSAGGKYLLCPCNWSKYLEDTMFGFFFRQALTGVADINKDGWVSVREAYHYLRFPVIWHSLWFNFPYIKTEGGIDFRNPQIPFLYDKHIGSINIIKI